MTDRSDLARLGQQIGDDGMAWVRGVRGFASPRVNSVESDEAAEFVAAQVYAEVEGADPETVREFVEAIRDVYGLETLSDVDRLLGRERTERRSYEGMLAMQGAE